METKHTKGEWSVTKEPFTLLVTHQIKGNTESICQISTRYKTEEEIEANAKLIAAAPELLEALIEINKLSDNCHADKLLEKIWDISDRAINKATK